MMVATSEQDAPSGAQLALSAHQERMRVLRRRYVLIVLAVVAVITVGVAVSWFTGEAHSATLQTATTPDPALPDEPLAAPQSVAWTSNDVTATGSYVSYGTVVTYSDHTVAGRNSSTGAVRWSYTRTDVTVCGVDTQDGIAVAIFDKNGNCDEAIGLDIATGQRRWNRTLFDNGMSTMSSRPSSVAITSKTAVHVISPGYDASNVPSGGLDRWNYIPAGCTINSAVLGEQGVLVSQTCPRDAPFLTRSAAAAPGLADASGAPAGAPVTSLMLRKPYDDGQVWSVDGDPSTPLLVTDAVVLAWDATSDRLVSYIGTTGVRDGTVTLPGCTGGATPTAGEFSTAALVYCGGTLSSLGVTGGQVTVLWSVAATGLPAIQSASEVAAHSAVTPTNAGLITLSTESGATLPGAATPIPADAAAAVSAAARLARFGGGLLVAGTTTLMLSGGS